MESTEIRKEFRAQTTKVRCNNSRHIGARQCVTPSLLGERKFAETGVVGVVENPKKKYMVEKRVSPTVIRRRLKSKVFGIAE